MFSRENRATYKDISEAHSRFSTLHTPTLSLSYLNTHLGHAPKLACSVSKKVAKRASDRSLLKRQCRAAAKDALPLIHGHAIIGIIRVKRPVPFDILSSEVRSLFEKVAGREGAKSR